MLIKQFLLLLGLISMVGLIPQGEKKQVIKATVQCKVIGMVGKQYQVQCPSINTTRGTATHKN